MLIKLSFHALEEQCTHKRTSLIKINKSTFVLDCENYLKQYVYTRAIYCGIMKDLLLIVLVENM